MNPINEDPIVKTLRLLKKSILTDLDGGGHRLLIARIDEALALATNLAYARKHLAPEKIG